MATGDDSKEADRQESERKRKIISTFEDKRRRYQAYWGPIYQEVEKHRRFTLLGKQFEEGEARRLGLRDPKEPNLLLTYANHEANKTLMTDYRGKVSPNGGSANEVQARARQHVLRGLQRRNNITQIFNKVRREQVAGGIAYSLAVVDYAGKRGFGKTLRDEFLDDYANVFPDPTVKSVTFDDARDFLICKHLGESEWEEETGKRADFRGKKKKDLWHYFVREDVRDREYLMDDDSTKLESSLPKTGKKKDVPDLSGVKRDEGGETLGRPIADYIWCWYKIADGEILDEDKWLGSYSPLVACTGRRVDSREKTQYQPLTQFAEEPQRIYTIIENIIQLRLSKSPFSKWKVAFESIDVKEFIKLREASLVGDTDVVYKSLTKDGKRIPPPEEIEPHILDDLLVELQRYQEMKIQKIFGIFDANLGNRTNEQSGIAIERRQAGGEISNYDLQFNYLQYVEQVNRVKLDLIPKYITAPQQMAFVDEDDKTVLQWVNTTGGVSFSPDEEYSLSIEALPISPTAREEEALALSRMAEVVPMLASNPKILALIVRAQPGRYSAQISDLLAGENPEMEQAKALLGQMQQELQRLTEASRTKIAQDQITIATLRGTLTLIRQQTQLLRTINQADKAENQGDDPILQLAEIHQKSIENQIRAYEAESERTYAKADLLDSVSKFLKPPDPPPGARLLKPEKDGQQSQRPGQKMSALSLPSGR